MPARVSTAAPTEAELGQFLTRYGISNNGFIPENTPLLNLPHSAYAPWESLVSDLPNLIKTQKIRQKVDELPIISTEHLHQEAEWQRGYVMLAFLTHAYLWGGNSPSEIVPPQITVPFLTICRHLDLPPVLTYAASNLWNFTLAPGDSITDPEALTIPTSFTGTKSETWFLGISISMEAAGAPVIPCMVQAMNMVKDQAFVQITEALYCLRDCINDTRALLERMPEYCIPEIFYHEIRPFLAGSAGMTHVGLPNGVFYDEGHGKGEWKVLRGGSNGQSTLIQFWDLVLGVNHKGEPIDSEGFQRIDYNSSNPQKLTFFDEVREYMPGPHRAFLKYVRGLPSIRKLALSQPRCQEHKDLERAYQEAIDSLAKFRNSHMSIVTRYIILPSRRVQSNGPKVDLAGASAGNNRNLSLTGTGGTPLIPFLKNARDDTLDAGKLY